MDFLRNPEIKRSLLIHATITVIATSIAFTMGGGAGLLVLILCMVFIGAYLVLTYKRYRQIAKLSSEIDDILHGEIHISFEEYAEGELGILQSEIQKMTVRLREQQQNLQLSLIHI